MDIWDILTVTDWISPILAAGEAVFGGKSNLNVYMVGSGMTGHEVVKLLRSHGVQVGAGGQIIHDHACITVDDEELARRVLEAHGLAVD